MRSRSLIHLLAPSFVGLVIVAACASATDDAASNDPGSLTFDAGVDGNAAGNGGGGGKAGAATGGASSAGASGSFDAGVFPDGSTAGGAGGSSGAGGGGGSAGSAGGSGGTAGGAGGGAGGAGGMAGAGGSAGGSSGAGNGGAGGVGGAVCMPSWTTPLPNNVPGRLVAEPGGLVYLSGKQGTTAWLGGLSPCTGALTVSATAPTGATSALMSLQLSPTHVFAGGTTDMVGLTVRAKKDTLTVEANTALVGSSGGDEIWDVTPSPQGNLWHAGVANVKTAPALWVVEGVLGATGCGFAPVPGDGLGRAAVVAGGNVYVVGQNKGQGIIARFADTNCMAQMPCTCAPLATGIVNVGSPITEIRHVAATSTKLFVVGFGSDGVDSLGFVSRVDLASLAVEATFKWNPTPQTEAFLSVAVNGASVVMSGLWGWTGDAPYTTATGVLMSLPITFGPATPAEWTYYPPGSHVMWGVSAAAGSIYATGTGASGFAMKCPGTGC